MKIKCLIVDDEPLSQEVMETYVRELPVLELVKTCNNAVEALDALRQHAVQLIFLDINMPVLSGINMIRSLATPPLVIFTTAYEQHAVDGFELNAIDYLLKPFSFERFLKAVNKAQHKLETELAAAVSRQPPKGQDFVAIKADKKLYKIDFDDITWFNSVGDYVKVHTRQGKVIITNETLRNIELELPADRFIRVHKSYIVSLKMIKYIEGNQLVIDQESIPIGQTYKEALISRFNRQF